MISFKDFFRATCRLLTEGFDSFRSRRNSRATSDNSAPVLPVPADKALAAIDPVNRGILMGECFKIFEKTGNNYILILYSPDGSAYKIKEKSEKPIAVTQDNSFIISRGYMEKRFNLLNQKETANVISRLVHAAEREEFNSSIKEYSYGSIDDLGFTNLDRDALIRYVNDRTVKKGPMYSKHQYTSTIESGDTINRLTLRAANAGSAQNSTKGLKMYSSTVTNTYSIDSAKKCIQIGEGFYTGWIFILAEAGAPAETKTVYIVNKEKLNSEYGLFSTPKFLGNFAATVATTGQTFSEMGTLSSDKTEANKAEEPVIKYSRAIEVRLPEEILDYLKWIEHEYKLERIPAGGFSVPRQVYKVIRSERPDVIDAINKIIGKIRAQRERDRRAGLGKSARYGKHPYA